MTKKIITLLSFLLALNLNQFAKAEITDGLMFKTALTAEYQGQNINGSGQNDQFKQRLFEQQLKNFDNIAVGFNFRVHKYLGFNLNLAKNTLKNTGLNGFDVAGKATLNVSNINATSLWYFPIVGDHWLEGFGEIGVADVNSQIKFVETNGNATKQQSHETALLWGAGIQFAPYDYDIAFRFGFQKYQTNLGLVNAKMTTFRGGVLIPF